MTQDTTNEEFKIEFLSVSVFEQVINYIETLKNLKKKKIDVAEVLAFLESLYYDKQTINVNIDSNPVQFEGLHKEQVDCFLKIFDGYKKSLESNNVFGKVVRNDDFEEVTTEKPKVIQIPTPPLK